jgi:hypothetical protein
MLKMKNRILVALLLAVALALPAVAQTTTTTPAQPAAQTATSADHAATVGASGKEPLGPPAREGFWGRINPPRSAIA